MKSESKSFILLVSDLGQKLVLVLTTLVYTKSCFGPNWVKKGICFAAHISWLVRIESAETC